MCFGARVQCEGVQSQFGRDARNIALMRQEIMFRRMAENYFQLERRMDSEKDEGMRRRLMPWWNTTSRTYDNSRNAFIQLHDQTEREGARLYLDRIATEVRNRVYGTGQNGPQPSTSSSSASASTATATLTSQQSSNSGQSASPEPQESQG